MKSWRITRCGHASKGKDNSKINTEIKSNRSQELLTVSMQVTPAERWFFLTTITFPLRENVK